MIGFDLAQTFFLDKDAVQKSATAAVTSIDLFFYKKPVAQKTKSGISFPGVSVALCEVDDAGAPNIDRVFSMYVARVEYANISGSTTGATATTFTFPQPVILPTDRSYGILIQFDGSDPDFKLWYNKAGDVKYGTTTLTQVTSGKVDGYFYTVTNGKTLTPHRDTDLSFKVKVAKYTETTQTFSVVNRPYEIYKVSSIQGSFKGGETAYLAAANSTGTVLVNSAARTIVGTGTSFTSVLVAGDKFVITDGTLGNTDVRTVTAVTNATSITVDVAPSFNAASGGYFKTVVGKVYLSDKIADYVVLQDVNSNTTLLSTTGVQVRGVDSLAYANITAIEDYRVNSVVPNFYAITPAGTSITYSVNFSNTSYGVTPSLRENVTLGQRKFLNKYPAIVASRTNELGVSSTFKSFDCAMTLTTATPYASPILREHNLDVFSERYSINNDATGEVTGQGNALAKYVSKTVNLASDQRAEDLKVYVRTYKPANSSVLVYAKFRNSEDIETLDAKQWTLLDLTSDANVISNPVNMDDLIEQEYAIPFYGTTSTSANGTFAASLSNAVIVGTTTDVNTYIVPGDMVRVYSPLFPTTYTVDTVVSSNTTTFTLSNAISNSSLVQTGMKVDVLENPQSGFLDIQNNNVLTYFNSSYAKFQGYDSFVLKVVLLSDNAAQVPFLDDIRAIAVSA